jgi:hypothetical protein
VKQSPCRKARPNHSVKRTPDGAAYLKRSAPSNRVALNP